MVMELMCLPPLVTAYSHGERYWLDVYSSLRAGKWDLAPNLGRITQKEKWKRKRHWALLHSAQLPDKGLGGGTKLGEDCWKEKGMYLAVNCYLNFSIVFQNKHAVQNKGIFNSLGPCGVLPTNSSGKWTDFPGMLLIQDIYIHFLSPELPNQTP